MAVLRFRPPSDHPVLHLVTSKLCSLRPLMDEPDKEWCERMLKINAAFCGMRLVSWAILDDRFHVLTAPEDEDVAQLDESEVVRRLRYIYTRDKVGEIRSALRDRASAAEREALLDGFRQRMGDISYYVRVVKQRLTLFSNHRLGGRGHMWETKFQRVMVQAVDAEGGPSAAARVASAYIDLGPVRHGLCNDPAQYRWSGYGAASTEGDKWAMSGLRWLWGGTAKSALAAHRAFMDEGKLPVVRSTKGRPLSTPRLSLPEILRRDVRYMTSAEAMGTREFVEAVVRANPECFANRRSAPAPMRFGEWGDLNVLRALACRVVLEKPPPR